MGDKYDELLNFDISSALKSVIGKDLITNDFVALFELVKNSFDARAKNITITFFSTNGVISKICIVDDGKGMSYDDLVNKWLFVAYSAKQDGSEDNNEHLIYAGNKGVGRFSCDRIGGYLKLETKAVSDNVINKLNIDWGDFEKDAKEKFENIDIRYSKESEFSSLEGVVLPKASGTVLEITNLRMALSWDRAKLLRLRRYLAKLVNPFGDAKSSIKLRLLCERELPQDEKVLTKASEAQEREDSEKEELVKEIPEVVNGEIKNVIFDLLKSKTTWFQVDLSEDGFFTSQLIDRGELIYKIREPSDAYPELSGSEFRCEIFYLNLSAKQTFKLRTGIHSVNFGSLFLFRNGFRVFPIGDEKDDFWNIDYRHQQGYARTLATRDVMGRVDIAGPETKFKEASSRDQGLIETDASLQLYDYVVNKCLKRLQNYVVGVTWKDSIDKTYDTAQRLTLDENRSNIIELVTKLSGSKEIELLDYSHELVDVLHEKSTFFENSVEKLSSLAETIDNKELRKSIERAKKKFAELKASELEALEIANEEYQARKKAEKDTAIEKKLRLEAEQKASAFTVAYEDEKKRNLFLLSSENRDKEQLESFLHQIIIYTSSLKQKVTSALLKMNGPDYQIDKEFVTDSYSDLLESVEKIITTSRFATSANFKLDSTLITDDLCLYVEQYVSKISTAYNSRIQIIVEVSAKPFITKFTPIELGMILDNLVSNAKKARASNIVFNLSDKTNGVLQISVKDNGKGLDKSIIEPHRIFDKGLTTTRGSGLGLYHTKKQIERMGGEISLPEKLPETGFELILKLRKT